MDDPERRPGQRALRKGRVSIAGQVYLVTTVVQSREPVFHDFPLARAAVRGLRTATNAVSARWLAWVLMPDHFHGLLSLGEGSPLSTVMGLAKGRMAREVNQARGFAGPF